MSAHSIFSARDLNVTIAKHDLTPSLCSQLRLVLLTCGLKFLPY